MATTQFVLPSNLQYSQPSERLTGTKNFTQFAAVGATSYSPGDTIKIAINSNNQFLDVSRSYLRFKVKAAGTSASTHKIPAVGYAYLLKDVSTTVGGVTVENIADYNKYISILYKKLPDTQLAVLKKLESTGTQNSIAIASANGIPKLIPKAEVPML